MKQAYRNAWRAETGMWSLPDGSLNGVSRLKNMMLAVAGVVVALGAQQAHGSGWQLCNDSKYEGYGWGHRSTSSLYGSCSPGFTFSLGSGVEDDGTGGFNGSNARVSARSNGVLELKGVSSISILGEMQLNGDQLKALYGQTITANSKSAVSGKQLFDTQGSLNTLVTDIEKQPFDAFISNSSGQLMVGEKVDGAEVGFSGTDGMRRLTGVGNGQSDHEAVTLAQFGTAVGVDADNRLINVFRYDASSMKAMVTLGGTNGTLIAQVADGAITADSKEAINGSQLYVLQQQFGELAYRVTNIEEGRGGVNSTAVGAGASASGTNSTALGQTSNASGENSTALGQNASATAKNAVALGQGSVADRDNSVSVGGPGAERQITHVAAGSAPTDAVNLQQMNDKVDSARRDAYGGIAAALAVAGLPQSTQPGRTFVALGGGTYGGEYGAALGVSYMTQGGRWTLQGSATTSSRKDVGGSVSVGFRW